MSEAVAAAILENAEEIGGLRKARTAVSEHQTNKAIRHARQ
jgi:hypothetical protein